MPTREDIAKAEKQLKEQLKKVKLAKAGLPTDGTVVTTQADVARHFKVQRSTVHTWLEKDDFPCKEPPFDLKKIEAWREAQQIEDAIISGENSPALERLRAAKASQEEIKLEQMRGSVVSVEVVRSVLGRLASMLRMFGVLANKLCPQLAGSFNDMLGEFEQVIEEEFGE